MLLLVNYLITMFNMFDVIGNDVTLSEGGVVIVVYGFICYMLS